MPTITTPFGQRRVLGATGWLVALAAAATACADGAQTGGPGPQAADKAPIVGLVDFGDMSRDHVPGTVDYEQIPPVGGAHSGESLQNCGFYSTPVQDEYAVHSLEHGAVWITYSPDLPAGQADGLRTFAESGDHVLVSPYDGLPSPVVASAWGLQLRLDSADDDRLEAFVSQFAEGPQTPEPGAPCDGGAGVPE